MNQNRIEYLAERANEGTLTAEERSEYEWYIRELHRLATEKTMPMRKAGELKGGITRGELYGEDDKQTNQSC